MNEEALIGRIENADFHEAYLSLNLEGSMLIGNDEAGQLVLEDLESVRHLLIAGACGSGKSVCINALIISMLLGCNSDKIKFIMIDPKAVELSMYKGLAHLMYPIITDSKQAVEALDYAVNELKCRYESSTSDMPRIVIIIDEVVDLLCSSRESVEKSLIQILERGSEVGIHLIMSAQNPASGALSGTLSVGVPSRICLRVISENDSKVVLGISGGEKLRGNGDMLFMPFGALAPTRIQGAYISDTEIEAVVHSIDRECTNH